MLIYSVGYCRRYPCGYQVMDPREVCEAARGRYPGPDAGGIVHVDDMAAAGSAVAEPPRLRHASLGAADVAWRTP